MTITFSAERQDQLLSLSGNHTIPQLLSAQLEHVPDAIALTGPGRAPLSYRQLLGQVELMAASLHGIGVGRRDRVAVVLPNGPEMAVAFLAVSSGAIFAPLNPACRENDFEFYLSDLQAKTLIVQSGIDSPANSVARRQGIRVIEITPWLEAEARLSTPPVQEKLPSVPQSIAEPDDVALVLYTSGTTSKPKRVPLTHRNLCASADSIKSTLQLSRGDRCLNLMPLFHIHGLVGGLLSSLAAGASVAVPEQFDADHVFQWMEELQPTWYTAVPTIHHAILREARSRSGTHREWPLRVIRSSSAPLPAKLMAELEEFFKVPVIEAYGMTEASHQIASNPLPPKERKSGSVGLPAGSTVEIMDKEGNLLATGQIGEIVLRGMNISRGYEENIEANRAAFTDGWFRTGDQGYLDADGYLYITSRIKEIINRGGEKISPHEVEAVLMEHPAISEAVVFPLAHETLGEDVAAAVVPKPNASITESDLQRFAFLKLPDFKTPRRIAIVDQIPKGPTGKVRRIELAEQLGLGAIGGEENQTRPEFVAPRTPVESTLAEIWREILSVEQVGVHDNFFSLGGHSLLAVRLVREIEKKLDRRLPVAMLFRFPTVEQLAGAVCTEKLPERSSLVPIQSMGSKPPFFFVHGDYAYAYFARYVELDRPFYGLAQHLEGKVRHTRIEDIAADHINKVRAVQPEGPYFIGGHSIGGLIAFEMAQQLHKAGQKIALLALLDSSGPGDSATVVDHRSALSRVRQHALNVSRLAPQAKLNYVLKWLKTQIRTRIYYPFCKRPMCEVYHFFKRPLPQELEKYYIEVIVFPQIYRKMARSYVRKVYPGRVIYFNAQADTRVATWQRLAQGGLEVYQVSGDHLSMLLEPHVRELAKKLALCLSQAQSGKYLIRDTVEKWMPRYDAAMDSRDRMSR